jgi:hypothetical protein
VGAEEAPASYEQGCNVVSESKARVSLGRAKWRATSAIGLMLGCLAKWIVASFGVAG